MSIEICEKPLRWQKKRAKTLVRDMIPNRKFERIDLLIIQRYPRRTVVSKGWTGSVAVACARDKSGLIALVLWGNQVDMICPGDIIAIEDGWCGYSGRQKVVSAGRTGKLSIIDDETVFADLRSTILRRSRSPAR
ncbi:MAG: hypothetical protein VYA86_03255 [Candidatus Thermoplasmatota archaeon]|nr:hypothetical protein [Candidatus Thermoplasmatota archaeon]